MNRLAIIDYRAGNLTSVRLAFESLGVAAQVTADPAVIRAADRVVFPGVGAAGSAMANLRALGLVAVLQDVVRARTPLLGICLGTQIVFERSEEDGADGLGLLPGRVVRFRPANPRDKVPHMGWNSITRVRPHPVLAGIDDGSEFYFVHSYYPVPAAAADRLAVSEYAGVTFASLVGRDNLVASQFHPEKSGRAGLRLLQNFLAWDGTAPC